MMLIDPHIHASSRTTDDYEAMRDAGIVAIIEPAFWLGQPRTSIGSFVDYFDGLVGWERFRAAQFGIRHYCSIGLNSKEANNERLAEEVVAPHAIAGRQIARGLGQAGRERLVPSADPGRGRRAARLRCTLHLAQRLLNVGQADRVDRHRPTPARR